MRFVVLTGLSGAGKSTVVKALEDIGYYCVDNMPTALISKFAEICYGSNGAIQKVALVIDIRSGDVFNDLFNSLNRLKSLGYNYEILFLDASDEELVKRYKQTRRAHPLASDGRVLDGIEKERRMFEYIKNKSDVVIDTTGLSTQKLKNHIVKCYGDDKNATGLSVTIESFGFKYGIPIDADMVFDVRFLPNPFYIEDLKNHNGQESCVQDYVMSYPQSNEFLEKLIDMSEFLLPHFLEEGKTQLVIAIGCTGGKHRSVTVSNKLFDALGKKEIDVNVHHRDITKDIYS